MSLFVACALICLIAFAVYYVATSRDNAETQLMQFQYSLDGRKLQNRIEDNPNITAVNFRRTRGHGGQLWIFSFDIQTIGTIKITGLYNPPVGNHPRFIKAYVEDDEVPVNMIFDAVYKDDIQDVVAVFIQGK
ncbi:MAG: hypothetical protein LBH94_03655 [Deltaproteobacteria bacterium]|nr:hypothetical protein [Deltaproteobacteria bacterium]